MAVTRGSVFALPSRIPHTDSHSTLGVPEAVAAVAPRQNFRGRPACHVARLRPQHQLYELTVPRHALRLGRQWSGSDLTPREEQHLAGLDLGRVAEQRGEGGCDRGGKSAVLWEGFS